MKKTGSNVEFAVFGDANERVGSARRKVAPPHMRAEARMALYLTVAGLIEGGYTPSKAAELVSNEYQANGQRMEASSVHAFFSGIEDRSSAEMGEVATAAFGKNFVATEEMVLLRALPEAKEMAPVLRMAAAIVGIQFKLYDDRHAPARKG